MAPTERSARTAAVCSRRCDAARRARARSCLMDLGSSVLAVRAALGELDDDERAAFAIADAPLVEGAIAAGRHGVDRRDADGVLRAAEEARHVRKL